MISAEYGFHNENDYSESDREMKDEKTAVDEKTDENVVNIQRIDKVL